VLSALGATLQTLAVFVGTLAIGKASRGRVAPGCCLPGAPTDPDVPDSGIRLFETRVRYVGRERLGVSSG